MIFECPDEFKKHLESCTVLELVGMIDEFKRTLPEDTNYLKAAQAEMKHRAKKMAADKGTT